MKNETLNKFNIFVYSQKKKKEKKEKRNLSKPIVPFVTHHPNTLHTLSLRLGPLSLPFLLFPATLPTPTRR